MSPPARFDSPQTVAAGTQVVFTSWNDGATTPTRTFTNLNGSPTYTAKFKTQYQLTTLVTPAGTGSASGAGFYDAGTSANLDASPNSGYKFTRWSGPVSSLSSASTTVAMDAPQSVTASFSLLTTVSVCSRFGQVRRYGDAERYPRPRRRGLLRHSPILGECQPRRCAHCHQRRGHIHH